MNLSVQEVPYKYFFLLLLRRSGEIEAIFARVLRIRFDLGVSGGPYVIAEIGGFEIEIKLD